MLFSNILWVSRHTVYTYVCQNAMKKVPFVYYLILKHLSKEKTVAHYFAQNPE